MSAGEQTSGHARGVPLDAPTCPLCARPNACAAVAAGRFDVACWCTSVQFAPEALARVPADAVGKACLCRDCATRVDALAQPAGAGRA